MGIRRSWVITTIVVGLLAGSAVTVTAQEAAPQPPTEFTGVWCIGPEVAPDRAGTETTLEVGDEGMTLTRYQGGAWHNAVAMSDSRLQGDAYQTYENDTYSNGTEVTAGASSIVNADGAWVSAGGPTGTLSDGTEAGPVFVGQGAYAGLVALMTEPGAGPRVSRPEGVPVEFGRCAEVHGVILDGGPLPEPYLPE